MNKLTAEFRGKDLPSKKKEYVVYLNAEWDDLAREKNLTDETLKNIVIEVEQDKPRLEWLEQQGASLNPTQREMDPAPSVYVQAMEKYAKVKLRSADATLALKFMVKVAAALKDALANLPVIEQSSKPEVIVIFLYDTYKESLYIWLVDVLAFNACILMEENNQEEDMYNPLRRVVLAPMIFICDSAGTVNVQAFAANLQTRIWSAHCPMYVPSIERSFRKSVMDHDLSSTSFTTTPL